MVKKENLGSPLGFEWWFIIRYKIIMGPKIVPNDCLSKINGFPPVNKPSK